MSTPVRRLCPSQIALSIDRRQRRQHTAAFVGYQQRHLGDDRHGLRPTIRRIQRFVPAVHGQGAGHL